MVIMKDSKTTEIYDIPRRPRWSSKYSRYVRCCMETDCCCLGKRSAPAHRIDLQLHRSQVLLVGGMVQILVILCGPVEFQVC
jgi:hypothetical protein